MRIPLPYGICGAWCLLLCACGPQQEPQPAPAVQGAPRAALNSGLLPLDAQGRPYRPETEFEIDGPPIEYRQRAEFHDFGLVPLGNVVEHTWTLENTDDQPVRVRRVQPSCGCLTVRSERVDAAGIAIAPGPSVAPDLFELPPGARLAVHIALDTRQVQVKNADKLVHVQVISTSQHRPYLMLEAHIVADSPLQLNPETLELGRVPASAGATARLDLLPVGDTGTLPHELGPLPVGFEARLEQRDLLGRDIWTLTLDAVAPLTIGPLNGEFELRTRRPKEKPRPGTRLLDDPDVEWVAGPSYAIRFQGQAIGDLDVFPPQLVATGKVSSGGFGEATLSALLPGHRLRVTGTRLVLPGGIATHGQLELRALPIDADDSGRASSWKLELVAPANFGPLPLAGKAVLELDDLQFPTHELPFLVRLD
ncbi:MAG: DUF1573 domain-containing protein [Planctomycetes bacterium]|nr:DUF1573 domain-containing protein [Planctomycetota bacterium]